MTAASAWPVELWWAVTGFVALAGLCLGSFYNVCIWRIPRDESIVWPGSHCPACGHALGLWDNLPLVSWLGLRGKCRYCGGRISPRYFWVELLTGVLYTGLWLKWGWSWEALAFAGFAGGLIVGSFIDFDHYILPDRITWGGMAFGLAAAWLVPGTHGMGPGERWAALADGAIGLAAGAGLLWTVGAVGKAVLKKDAMGLGDVKLLGAIGAMLGWKAVLFTILASSLTGTATGVALMALGKRELSGRIPYGPHLALGALAWMFFGPEAVAWYWGMAQGGGGGGGW